MSECNATLGDLSCMLRRGEHKTFHWGEMHQPLETRSGGLWGDDWPGAEPHVDFIEDLTADGKCLCGRYLPCRHCDDDVLRRIRETVEGEGAMRAMKPEVRLQHIARLLGAEYQPTVSMW